MNVLAILNIINQLKIKHTKILIKKGINFMLFLKLFRNKTCNKEGTKKKVKSFFSKEFI